MWSCALEETFDPKHGNGEVQRRCRMYERLGLVNCLIGILSIPKCSATTIFHGLHCIKNIVICKLINRKIIVYKFELKGVIKSRLSSYNTIAKWGKIISYNNTIFAIKMDNIPACLYRNYFLFS